MKRMILVLMLAMVLLPCIASAFTATVNGVNVGIKYEEPIENADSSTLTDLEYTSIYIDTGSGWVKAVDIPATAATGGGSISKDITVPVADGKDLTVAFKVTATDTSGNESADSEIIRKRIDRLSPAPPL